MPSVQIPPKAEFLIYPSRYKVLRGGRGSAKSWSAARILLRLGMDKPLRILCAREVQLSIKQSVHQLLKDQIDKLNITHFYEVTDHEIRGRNGTLITFTGLSTMTVDAIKSMEGVDLCWVEEGQVISKRSWKILIPTIRKSGSEIWITYNPELETDETHQRFTVNMPPGCINVEMNWRDNPWFNDVLETERLHCKETNPDEYDHIWEGQCLPAVSGAIYYKQIQEMETNRRICNVPHDAMLKTHPVLDLGWDDSLATALVQVHLSEIRVIEYLEFSHTDLMHWSSELKKRPYNWGRVWLPHDGYNKTLSAHGKSVDDILSNLGWDVPDRSEIIEMSVEQGIRHTRMTFPRMYFDMTLCAAQEAPKSNGSVKHTDLSNRLVECAKRYRRHINRVTETTSTPVKDKHAHGADCLRYIALNADSMTNEDELQIRIPGSEVSQPTGSWMGA